LGTALRLEDLRAVTTEHNVLGKRLDILAAATDENGEEVAVCIENQYGMSDADHLGRLIAYLPQHDRGRAVWVVEQAHVDDPRCTVGYTFLVSEGEARDEHPLTRPQLPRQSAQLGDVDAVVASVTDAVAAAHGARIRG
jgi:hypothetical protein